MRRTDIVATDAGCTVHCMRLFVDGTTREDVWESEHHVDLGGFTMRGMNWPAWDAARFQYAVKDRAGQHVGR